MERTAYDWHDLSKLISKGPTFEETGNCHWNKKNNQVEFQLMGSKKLQPSECSSFPMEDIALEKEISGSLPLQFTLLWAYSGSTSADFTSPKTREPKEFQHIISTMLHCFRSVHPRYQKGEICFITGTGLLPNAQDMFRQLFSQQKLHPCIQFLASRVEPESRAPFEQSLYEIHNLLFDPSQVSEEAKEFAAFLKSRCELTGDVTACPLSGYSFSELDRNADCSYILSRFSRSFYMEETETKLSCGFYLLS